jgi:hypothetical protein
LRARPLADGGRPRAVCQGMRRAEVIDGPLAPLAACTRCLRPLGPAKRGYGTCSECGRVHPQAPPHESRLSPTASREGRCRRELETRTSSRHGHQRVNMHLCSRRRPRCAARFDWRSRCRSTVHEISSGPREISSGPAVDHVARLARRRVGDTVRREPPGNALPPRQPQPR